MATKSEFFTDYTSLGQILVRHGFITKRQLARALKVQADKKLGEVVSTLGYCTKDEVQIALSEQQRSRFIPNGVDGKSDSAFERASLALKRIENCVGDEPTPEVDSSEGVVKIDL